MSIEAHIRRSRRELGLTQSELAQAADVSLATVQNAEAGRANPSLSTLARMAEPLGLRVILAPDEADWGALIALGLPLSGQPSPHVTRDAATLRRHIGCAALALAREPNQPGAERKRECLHALLHALHGHFPGVTRRWMKTVAAPVRDLLGRPASGRVIKLSRIARANLAEYL